LRVDDREEEPVAARREPPDPEALVLAREEDPLLLDAARGHAQATEALLLGRVASERQPPEALPVRRELEAALQPGLLDEHALLPARRVPQDDLAHHARRRDLPPVGRQRDAVERIQVPGPEAEAGAMEALAGAELQGVDAPLGEAHVRGATVRCDRQTHGP